MNRFTVIRDTREKPTKGWTFPPSDTCAGTVVGTLKTGDYSILGLEHIITIERKASAVELAGNLFAGIDRFRRELERMETFRFAVVACEFPILHLAGFPNYSKLSRRIRSKLVLDGNRLMKRLVHLQEDYPYVEWVFDRRAEQRAERFLARVWAAHCRGEILVPTDVGEASAA